MRKVFSQWTNGKFSTWSFKIYYNGMGCVRLQNENNDLRGQKIKLKKITFTHYTSCHPPGDKRGFIKGKVIRLLRTNSSEINYQEAISSYKTRLQTCGYPNQLVEKTVSEVTFAGRQSALHKQN